MVLFFCYKEAGCYIHFRNLANGSCGTAEYSHNEIVAIRRKETINSASLIGAVFYESLVNDREVFYSNDIIRRVTAIVREIKPDIMLLQSPQDYMEDHMNATRIGVTSAFCRG